MKLTALDCDRHSKRSEVGSCSILLKDVKALSTVTTTDDDDVTVTSALAQKKQEFGEIHFGMSYLPTAQRLSFSIGKATNLKYQEITEKLENFGNIFRFCNPTDMVSYFFFLLLPPAPYVRVLQINAMGRIIKKKKTNAKAGTANPGNKVTAKIY